MKLQSLGKTVRGVAAPARCGPRPALRRLCVRATAQHTQEERRAELGPLSIFAMSPMLWLATSMPAQVRLVAEASCATLVHKQLHPCTRPTSSAGPTRATM